MVKRNVEGDHKKVERRNCAKYLVAKSLERYGEAVEPIGKLDKYDVAAMKIRVLESGGNDIEMHIDQYFWGDMDM